MSVVENSGYSLYYATAGDAVTYSVAVTGFIWSGATAKTDKLTFKDAAGNIVWGPILSGGMGVASDTAKPIVVMFSRPKSIPGLEVDVLDAGTVTVFLA